MFLTCSNVLHMSKMIQIRNVPDSVHRTLKARAAAAGMSLSDYLRRDLEEAAARPSLEELDDRVTARRPSGLRAQTIVGELRGARER